VEARGGGHETRDGTPPVRPHVPVEELTARASTVPTDRPEAEYGCDLFQRFAS
jgi:hypothetical protein